MIISSLPVVSEFTVERRHLHRPWLLAKEIWGISDYMALLFKFNATNMFSLSVGQVLQVPDIQQYEEMNIAAEQQAAVEQTIGTALTTRGSIIFKAT